MAIEMLETNPSGNAEAQKPVMYGTGVLIINAAGEIVVAEQESEKPVSRRKKGQQSIPLETAKVETGSNNTLLRDMFRPNVMTKIALEDPERTLEGAMAEVVNNRTLDNVGRDSFHTLRNHHYLASKTCPGVFAKVEIVFYSGDMDTQFVSAHPEEIGTVSWVNPYDFLAKEDSESRPLAKEIVNFALKNDLINQSILDHRAGKSVRVFQDNFSIDTAHQKREEHTDINIIYTS